MSDIQVVVFHIQSERYGVNIHQVRSIERMMPITPVPRTLSFIRGVMNLRGVVTPVIDLRERFGFASETESDETRVMVVNVKDVTVGFIVDAVSDVQVIPTDCIETPPAVVGGVQAVYLDGVARLDEQLIILLNLERVLSDVEEQQLIEVEKSVHG